MAGKKNPNRKEEKKKQINPQAKTRNQTGANLKRAIRPMGNTKNNPNTKKKGKKGPLKGKNWAEKKLGG